MRTLLVALVLAVAAFAAVPSASAAAAPPVLPACVPPGVESFGVCAGTVNGNPCVWVWTGPSLNMVCVQRSPADVLVCDNGGCQSVRDTVGSMIAQPDPVCVPPGVESFGVCVGLVDGDVCAWIWFGPSFRIVCLGDILKASASSSSAGLPVGCVSTGVAVCVWPATENGACVGVGLGLQGAGACVDTDPVGVRVCTSARTVLYEGYCPTDGLTILDTTLA
jgi:hypothetical protein